jgi:hypothetical protein
MIVKTFKTYVSLRNLGLFRGEGGGGNTLFPKESAFLPRELGPFPKENSFFPDKIVFFIREFF